MEHLEEEQEEKHEPRWRINDRKALKSGTRHTIYWVKNNALHKEYQRDGALAGCFQEPPKFKTGDSYAGGWLHNKKHGFGICSTDKFKYQGDWKNGKRDGTGTLWVKENGPDGVTLRKLYTGEFKNNKRHGIGIFYENNGNTYEGEFVAGKKSGRGKMFYANGDVYDGEFENNVRSGLGILKKGNGDRYEGHWLNDVREGPGRYFYHNTRKVYQGEWIKDSPKAGVYHDWPDSYDDESKSGADETNNFQLPSLGLDQPDQLLKNAFAETRRQRAENFGEQEEKRQEPSSPKEGSTPNAFTLEELDDIANAFSAVDQESQGFIIGSQLVLVLNELGIYPLEEDIVQLLDELGATEDSEISLKALIGLLAALRAPEDEEHQEP